MILIFKCKNLSPECWLNFNIADFFIELVIILNVDTPFTQFHQEKVDSEESHVCRSTSMKIISSARVLKLILAGYEPKSASS